ncbi:YceI family protein [Pseudopedobacter saltans DSM 12145]|uniref:YceI family protein n=1 Tax=Pseudopedobacter saltans (strain ATCC 51119 / DSM 12145 / JCM 21818 / CCUG 39354 / LMG 10337 / NBRC 100064 / NCIMB 13643) TaxID=762903 RepID=F0S7J2_PSESL|nr:YceI family protein [Pseudopedobacter saltans]ADY52252.1 YceI family protein [Pseudopedobacter saltans DSM 12145]
MKKLVLPLLCVALFAACNNNPKGNKAATSEAVTDSLSTEGTVYNIDTVSSTLHWTGSKVTGSHHGTVRIQSGKVLLNGQNHLVGGDFTVDMKSIVNEDLKGNDEYKNKLENHLKSEDFFHVEKNPTATFKITEVKNQTSTSADVSGNLTIRGISKNITFPVQLVSSSNDAVTATADFNINRKDWGIVYEGMKDDLIADEINLKVSVTAKK